MRYKRTIIVVAIAALALTVFENPAFFRRASHERGLTNSGFETRFGIEGFGRSPPPARAAAPRTPLEQASPAFRFASVERGSLEQIVTVTGTLQPVETVEVGSQLSGQISKLYVDFNDRVHEGDALAQVDPRTFRAKVEESRSSVEAARAEVDIAQAKLDRARIDLANVEGNRQVLSARLQSAEALKGAASRNAERKTALRARDVGSASSVDDAEADLASKTALAEEAKSVLGLNTYSVAGASTDVKRLEAELAQAKALLPQKEAILRAAEADLDRTVIRSPMDGVVVGRFVNKGQTLAVGLEARTTFTIAHNLEDMEIHAKVDETDIGRVEPGQRAVFTVDAFPGRRFDAVVRQVRKAPLVTQNVVTYTVVLATRNPDGALLPGMTALVKLIIEREDNVLKVPLAALRFRPSDAPKPAPGSQSPPAVWVRSASGEIRPVVVTVGAAGPDQVSLKAGSVSEGDEVVVGQAATPPPKQWFGIRFGS